MSQLLLQSDLLDATSAPVLITITVPPPPATPSTAAGPYDLWAVNMTQYDFGSFGSFFTIGAELADGSTLIAPGRPQFAFPSCGQSE